jgi:hypothetical protein
MTDLAQVQRGTVALTKAQCGYPPCCLAASRAGRVVDNYRREFANLGDTRWSPEP